MVRRGKSSLERSGDGGFRRLGTLDKFAVGEAKQAKRGRSYASLLSLNQ